MISPHWQKALAVILCAVMVLTVFPVMALASDQVGSEEPLAETAPLLPEEELAMGEEVTEETLTEELPICDESAEPVLDAAEALEPVDDASLTEAAEEPAAFSMSCVNPCYEDVADGEEDVVLDGATELVIDGYYSTIEEAAAVVREQMKSRGTSFVFVYKTTSVPTTEFYETTLSAIVEQALAHTGDPKEGDYLRWQYKRYWANADGYYKNGTYYLNFHYSFTYYTTASQEASLDKAVNALLAKLDVAGLNDYAKISAIYDYICANVDYDYYHKNSSGYTLKYTAYAALMNGTAVCQGYATLLYRLALELGVDCRVIPGTAKGEEHRWNIALVNGSYYNLDSTWDAGESEYACFLVSNTNLKNHSRSSAYTSATFNSSYPMSEEDFSLDAVSDTDLNWDNVQWSVSGDVLTVAGSGNIPDCDSPDQTPWAEESFSEIVITGNLTGIGTNSFTGNVEKVTVGENVISIGQDAFAECDALQHIYIMNDDCEIYDAAGTLGDPATTVVHCYYNSTAMAYAEKYGYKYINMGYANCTLELEVTTANSAAEPVVRIYDASATDLVIYRDIVQDEPSETESCYVEVSAETQRADGLYSRQISLQDVELGRYNLAVYVPGGYVIRIEPIRVSDNADLGELHAWLYGDVDDNGTVDARDATQIYRQASDLASLFGSTGVNATETMRLRASDVNSDGMYTEEDAAQVLLYLNGQASVFDQMQ